MRLFVFALALALPVTGVQAQNLRIEKDGVVLSVFQLSDRLVFCFNEKPGVKISSDYGVNFTIPESEKSAWNETFPKLVSQEGWYFDMPLRIELLKASSAASRHLSLDLGACYDDKNLCNRIELEIEVPSSPLVSKFNCKEKAD
jgi:hypothetical protein